MKTYIMLSLLLLLFSCECIRTKTWIFLAPRYVLWSECLCLPQIGMLKLNPQSNGIRRWRPWDVTRAWEQSPHEWDKCPYKEVQHSTLAPFHHVKIQWDVRNQKRPLSWQSWYSDFYPLWLWEIINVCCL